MGSIKIYAVGLLIMLWTGVLPLRAVASQILFLLVAIALEGMVLRFRLGLTRKQSMQYAVTVNLLSTVMGWMVFFIVERWLPDGVRSMLIGYVFFGVKEFSPMLLMMGFGAFLATFLLKIQGMDLLDLVMEEPKEVVPIEERSKFRGRKRRQTDNFQTIPNRSLALLWANACSFSAISLLLVLGLFM
jgi:hypothetical protein